MPSHTTLRSTSVRTSLKWTSVRTSDGLVCAPLPSRSVPATEWCILDTCVRVARGARRRRALARCHAPTGSDQSHEDGENRGTAPTKLGTMRRLIVLLDL